ncbi:hypothetical protein [Rubellimicrobium mesophilum]|nr:hypothetical protein [Rubellimicrobium mesophilum]
MTSTFASFDIGPSSVQGPWLTWSAQTRGFMLRTGSGKEPFAGFESGVVLDIDTMRTGWQRSDGIAGVPPEWQWNQSLSQFEPRPGEDWKQGFHILCGIGDGQTAIWEQAGASAWNGFLGLVPALRQQPAEGVLPLVKLVGTREARFNKGKATIPLFEVAEWVPRPACLVDSGISTAPSLQRAAAVGQTRTNVAAPARNTGPAYADLDDEIPF